MLKLQIFINIGKKSRVFLHGLEWRRRGEKPEKSLFLVGKCANNFAHFTIEDFFLQYLSLVSSLNTINWISTWLEHDLTQSASCLQNGIQVVIEYS